MRVQSIATKDFAVELLRRLHKEISISTPTTNRQWTDVLWKFFNKYKSGRRPKWTMFPKERARKGEYLVDFILFEEGYGPRIAVESEWQYWRHKKPLDRIDWAFDKVRGVKADVKLLVYEWKTPPSSGEPDRQVRKRIVQYLENYALLTPKEAFVFLQYTGDRPYGYWWQPRHEGIHSEEEIKFQELTLE